LAFSATKITIALHERSRYSPSHRHSKGERQSLATGVCRRHGQKRTESLSAPKLFALAANPYEMVRHSPEEIANVIYPVGFYRNKGKNIVAISQELIDNHGGNVPDDLDELLKLPGVGRKTANLVLTAGFNKPGICVDIHVHRISNRWGYVKTKTPEQTEFALREKLPQEYWIDYNGLLVTFGQNLCTPVSPWCSKCPVHQFCDRVGVERSR
jgi:endonuclease-3